jgi:hypothetical protein
LLNSIAKDVAFDGTVKVKGVPAVQEVVFVKVLDAIDVRVLYGARLPSVAVEYNALTVQAVDALVGIL